METGIGGTKAQTNGKHINKNFERRKLSRNKEKILFSGAFQRGIYKLNEKTGLRAF